MRHRPGMPGLRRCLWRPRVTRDGSTASVTVIGWHLAIAAVVACAFVAVADTPPTAARCAPRWAGHVRVNHDGGSVAAQYARSRAATLVYDNTSNGPNGVYALSVGAEIGDDLVLVTAGTLDELSFSIYNSDEGSAHGLTSVDITFRFYDIGEHFIGSFVVDDLDLTDGGQNPPLDPGACCTVTLDALASLQIELPATCIVTQAYSDVVGDGLGTPSDLGQVLCDPPTIGSSGDYYYLRWSPFFGWCDFDGTPVASFYWAVGVGTSGRGDLNCDGAVDNFDIDPFVLALTSSPPERPEYYGVWPACDHEHADCNGDGSVNNFDIDPFVAMLVGD